MTNELLRTLVDLRDRQVQKARIQFGNRLSALDRQADTDAADGNQREILQRWFTRFEELEADLDSDIKATVREEPIFEYISAVKGIGPSLAAQMIAMIDIRRANTVSALWRYAGQGVTPEGTAEKPIKGEKLHYNKRLKTTMFKVGSAFLRANSPYRSIYDTAKVHYETTHPDWSKMRQHRAATRKMVKVFLSHLWQCWRQIEGLPVTLPFAQEILGHDHYMPPEMFGWPSEETTK